MTTEFDPGFIHPSHVGSIEVWGETETVNHKHQVVDARWNPEVLPQPRLEDMGTYDAHRLGFQEGHHNGWKQASEFFSQFFTPEDFAAIIGG